MRDFLVATIAPEWYIGEIYAFQSLYAGLPRCNLPAPVLSKDQLSDKAFQSLYAGLPRCNLHYPDNIRRDRLFQSLYAGLPRCNQVSVLP